MLDTATLPDTLPLLADLIAINSENPGGSEAEIVGFCAALLQRHGISSEIVEVQPGRPNLIARLEGRNDRKIIYQAHLDTKPAFHAGADADAWTRPPFHPTREGDRLYGLGACDTKGGAAAQLVAMIRLAQTWSRDMPTLEWQGVADEENGSLYGAEHLCESGALEADFAVIAEPTDGRVSFEQMGSIWVDITVEGEQCHGGMPWLGADAMTAGLELIEVMKAAVAQRERHPAVRFHPDVGIRILEGGGHAGTVAGHLRIVSDIRVRPDEDREDYRALWQQAAAQICDRHNVRIGIGEAAGGGCEPHGLKDASLRRTIESAWLDEFGQALEPSFFYGGSDARYFARVGTPAIVFGAGSLAHAHAPDEFVPVDEVLQCERFLSRLPRALARQWA
ncbi:M20/M25/M40 family metallo-hydrolase [Maricaulis sp.]|uniref:M20 family metallopeptidase n=1 Tax=Maricaulis sp. TaxID=1486257 RepID=UPI0026217AEE|nr:M20/M25/M40 family metallo-hydrolase [Maricaulis sp.]